MQLALFLYLEVYISMLWGCWLQQISVQPSSPSAELSNTLLHTSIEKDEDWAPESSIPQLP